MESHSIRLGIENKTFAVRPSLARRSEPGTIRVAGLAFSLVRADFPSAWRCTASPARRYEGGDALGMRADRACKEVVMEDSQIAAALAAQLAEKIGPQRFDLWFASQTRLSSEAACLTIHVANDFVRNWLRINFAHDVRACWEQIVGPSGTVEFAVDESLGQPAQNGQVEAGNPPESNGEHETASPPAARDGRMAGRGATRTEATLDTFIVGPSNEYAFSAAQLTASGRQQASPLVFCGWTGVGKTHLLRGIGREFRRRHQRASAVYLTAEQFTTCFIEAIRGSGLPSFRQKCRGATLLLIDDLQFFAGKQRTLEELQHTIDTLLADGRQLVLASDRSLAELRSLGPELSSRLTGGLICEIEPPEFATRLGILRQLCDQLGLTLDDKVLSMVAAQINAGPRELRGALNRLQAMSLAHEEPITPDMAQRALADLARHTARTVRLSDVQKAVCEVFGVEPAQLRSDGKGRALSEPRMLAMWLARKYTRAPWSEIGQFFGRRSHSTVIAANRRVEKLIGSQAQIGLNDRSCNVEEAIRRVEAALRTA
jgi:chromosomal replication initiator protein